jgi:hypothetical protein
VLLRLIKSTITSTAILNNEAAQTRPTDQQGNPSRFADPKKESENKNNQGKRFLDPGILLSHQEVFNPTQGE